MEAEIKRLCSTHWFHCNADLGILGKILPNFSDAAMSDGDLIDVVTEPLDDAWAKSRELMLTPIPFLATDSTAAAVERGVRILDFCKYASLNGIGRTLSPDSPYRHGDSDHHGGNGHGHGHAAHGTPRLRAEHRLPTPQHMYTAVTPHTGTYGHISQPLCRPYMIDC